MQRKKLIYPEVEEDIMEERQKSDEESEEIEKVCHDKMMDIIETVNKRSKENSKRNSSKRKKPISLEIPEKKKSNYQNQSLTWLLTMKKYY